MIGIINKLLYILTLSPFEKVPESTAPPLDGHKDDHITFVQLNEKNHGSANSDLGRLLGLNGNLLLNLPGQQLKSGGRYKRSNQISSVNNENDNSNLGRLVYAKEISDTSVDESEKRKQAEIEQSEKDERQTRVLRFGIWTYLLYAISVLWFYNGVHGSETLVVYMRRVAALMGIAVTIDLLKYFLDLKTDYYMKMAMNGLLVVVGLAASAQLIWALPQFYSELSKTIFKKK